MDKCKFDKFFTIENTIFLTILIMSVLMMILSPENANATVESFIKGVGSSLQKSAIGVAVAAFSIGGGGMMFGASGVTE